MTAFTRNSSRRYIVISATLHARTTPLILLRPFFLKSADHLTISERNHPFPPGFTELQQTPLMIIPSHLWPDNKVPNSLFDDDGSIDDLPDTGFSGTDREYIRREMSACIRSVVDQLPENYRTVLLLSEFEELTNLEVAEILDISIDTVKIRLHRGRTALRKALKSQCSLYHDERNELMCDRKA